MKTFDKFSEDFEKIILTRDFEDLSRQELELLDAGGITEAEFQNIKKTLQALESIEEESVTPSLAIKNNLLEAFDEKQGRKGLLLSFPFWITSGVSIAAILAIAFFMLKPSQDYNQSSTPLVEQSAKTESQAPLEVTESEGDMENISQESNKVLSREQDLPSPQISDYQTEIPRETERTNDMSNYSPDEASSYADIPDHSARDIKSEEMIKATSKESADEIQVKTYSQSPSANQGSTTTLSSSSVQTEMYSPISTTSGISVQELSKKSKMKPVAQKTSYSLADKPSDLNNLVTIY